MTLTLNGAAVKLSVFPVLMVLVAGTTVLGASGVLAAVSAPVRTSRVPLVATLLNGSWKTRGALVPTVFEICDT